jgi:hypothetical protein
MPALILIGIGVFFLLINTGVLGGVNLGDLWPIFPVLIGAGLLLQFFIGGLRDPDLVFGGTIFTLTGLFFFLFTLNVNVAPLGPITWSDMARLWPAFPTIVGIAFVLRWVLGGLRESGLLIPAAILLAVGLGGFSFTLAGFPAFRLFFDYWPVLLIILGVIVLARSVTRPRSES